MPSHGQQDGPTPGAASTRGANGVLYGTTRSGGMLLLGMVYALHPPAQPAGAWTEEVIHNFLDGTDGASLVSSLILDGAGNLYGTLPYRGGHSGGAVYELSPPAVAGGAWQFRTIYSFRRGADGLRPEAAPVFDPAGNLYGTTVEGGIGPGGPDYSCGTVFRLSPPARDGDPWVKQTLHSFAGPDGCQPSGALTLDAAGNLYGTTVGGGRGGRKSGSGVAFELSPPAEGGDWTIAILHRFGSGQADGVGPTGGVAMAGDGSLCGSTASGGRGHGVSAGAVSAGGDGKPVLLERGAPAVPALRAT